MEKLEDEGADGFCLPLPFSVPFPFPLSEPYPFPLVEVYGSVTLRLEGFHSGALTLGQLRSSKERVCGCGLTCDVDVTDCDMLDFGGVGFG